MAEAYAITGGPAGVAGTEGYAGGGTLTVLSA